MTGEVQLQTANANSQVHMSFPQAQGGIASEHQVNHISAPVGGGVPQLNHVVGEPHDAIVEEHDYQGYDAADLLRTNPKDLKETGPANLQEKADAKAKRAKRTVQILKAVKTFAIIFGAAVVVGSIAAAIAFPPVGVPVLVGVIALGLILEVSGARKAVNDKINKVIAENKQHAADTSKMAPLPADLSNAPAKHLTPDQLKLFEGAINKRLQAVTRDENKTKLDSLQAKVDSGKASWREKHKLKSLKKMEAQGKLGGGATLVQESDAMLRSVFLPGQANLPAHPQANHLHQPQFDVQNRQAPAAEQHVQAPGFQDFAADIVPKYQELDVKYNNIMNQNPEVGSDASFELRDKAQELHGEIASELTGLWNLRGELQTAMQVPGADVNELNSNLNWVDSSIEYLSNGLDSVNNKIQSLTPPPPPENEEVAQQPAPPPKNEEGANPNFEIDAGSPDISAGNMPDKEEI